MSPVSQPSSLKKPTTPLTPSAPPSPLFIQLTPNTLIPSAPSNFSTVISPPQQISPTTHDPSHVSKSQVPTNPHTLQTPPIMTNKASIKPLATKSISSATPKPCKFYMQGHCRYGEKGLGCSYYHTQMCFKFIKSGHKGCSKGDSYLLFLDQMKELKSQMIQMQQTQNFLLKNIMSQACPPLPAQKVAPFPAQMFETRPAQRLLPCFPFFL